MYNYDFKTKTVRDVSLLFNRRLINLFLLFYFSMMIIDRKRNLLL